MEKKNEERTMYERHFELTSPLVASIERARSFFNSISSALRRNPEPQTPNSERPLIERRESLHTDDSDERWASFQSSKSFYGSLKVIILASWMNTLLIFVPIGVATHMCDMDPLLVFTCNAIALVPLSSLLTDATERIAYTAGDTVGALLNISFGNLVELILL